MRHSKRTGKGMIKAQILAFLVSLWFMASWAFYADEFNLINLEPTDWEEVERVQDFESLCVYFAMKKEIPGWRYDHSTQECVLGKIRNLNTLVWHDNGFGLPVQVTTKHLKEMKMKEQNVVIVGGSSSSNVFNFNLDTETLNDSFISQDYASLVPNPFYAHPIMTKKGFLVCGGAPDVDQCWLRPFGSPSWLLQNGLKMNEGRRGAAHSIVRGSLFVSGGATLQAGETKSTEKFNGRAWVKDVDLPIPLFGHCQVTLSDNRVMIMAGLSYASYVLDTHILDTVTGKWEKRMNPTCILLKSSTGSDKVMAVWGYDGAERADVSMYDVDSDSWTSDDPAPTGGSGGIGFPSDDGKRAYFFMSLTNKKFKFLPEAPSGSRWVDLGPFNKGRMESYVKYTNGL